MTDIPPVSPDLLRSNTGRGQGVRRLNRMPLLIAMAILALIMGTIAYTYRLRIEAQRRAAQTERHNDAGAIGVLTTAPESGYIEPKAAVPPIEPPSPVPEIKIEKGLERKPNPYEIAWQAYYQRLERQRAAREAALFQAIQAPTEIKVQNQQKTGGGAQADTGGAPLSASEQFTRLAAARLAREEDIDDRRRDLNRQKDKADFIAERDPKSRNQNTLKARRESPRSPYEVKAGTVIPAIMIGGVNSDLPGQLLGQVAENVYDTATGRFIVIPQGSKLVGVYDAGITTGQERVLVAWTRIIYPDASSLDLGRMPGADEGGYAGFHDRVDDHFLKVWGNALLLSAFSAGIQLSQGNGNNTSGNLNSTQTIAASTGQQLGQLGQEIARRNLQIQPTLEIRPGYRFVVQVTKDLILKPWIAKETTTAFFGGYPYRGSE